MKSLWPDDIWEGKLPQHEQADAAIAQALSESGLSKPRIAEIRDALLLLSENERLEVFRGFCQCCGDYYGDERPCQCWNDE